MKRCTQCCELKALSTFYTEKLGQFGVKGRCKVCMAGYKVKNKLRDSIQAQHHKQRIKRAAFNRIGGCRCSLCFESEIGKLNVDHVHGDGVRLRKVGRHGKGLKFYNQILRMTIVERNRLRVLCGRCNNLANRYSDDEIRRMHLAELHGLKFCPGCDETKLTSEFQKDAGTLTGLRTKCKSCVAVYQQQKYQQRRNGNKRAA